MPTNLPLDAELDGEESEAQSKIEQAKLVGGLRVTGHTLRVRPGQGGRAICEEARAIKAAAIVMQLRYRNGKPLYGKTLQSVLADRPGPRDRRRRPAGLARRHVPRSPAVS